MTSEQEEYIRYLDDMIIMCGVAQKALGGHDEKWESKGNSYSNAKSQFIKIFRLEGEINAKRD